MEWKSKKCGKEDEISFEHLPLEYPAVSEGMALLAGFIWGGGGGGGGEGGRGVHGYTLNGTLPGITTLYIEYYSNYELYNMSSCYTGLLIIYWTNFSFCVCHISDSSSKPELL